MISFAPVQLPPLTAEGVPIKVPNERWKFEADLNRGLLTATSPTAQLSLPFATVMAASITHQDEVRATGKTIKRMFLAGAGAEIYSGRRDSGLGASLLDLSIRGVETQARVGGVLIWPDLSIVQFAAVGDELERLFAFIPRDAFADECVEQASEMIGLVGRMKNDGLRALLELADDILASSSQTRTMLTEAERGSTFEERDRARQSAQALAAEVDAKRSVCSALMNECGISARELIAQTQFKGASNAELLGSRTRMMATG